MFLCGTKKKHLTTPSEYSQLKCMHEDVEFVTMYPPSKNVRFEHRSTSQFQTVQLPTPICGFWDQQTF
jgi:hypothetical protein